MAEQINVNPGGGDNGAGATTLVVAILIIVVIALAFYFGFARRGAAPQVPDANINVSLPDAAPGGAGGGAAE